MTGIIGMIIVVLAYGLLAFGYNKGFIYLDILAGLFLIWHAVTIKDFPFFAVNVFIIVFLITKMVRDHRKRI